MDNLSIWGQILLGAPFVILPAALLVFLIYLWVMSFIDFGLWHGLKITALIVLLVWFYGSLIILKAMAS